MKKMLINATQPEEVRVALVDGQRLYDLDIENRARVSTKANVYKAKVTRVEPSLEAAFVDFGADRHGFLPLKEIAHEYYRSAAPEGEGKTRIKDVLKEGTELIVQVDKEERGTKGAALTTYISLAGRYMVLMPNNPRAGGISRRIEGDNRSELRDALSQLEIPDGMGVIIRTAGVGRSPEELQWDLDYLLQLWDAISTANAENKGPVLLYQESDVIIRAIRDYLRDDIDQVLIDDPAAYKQASDFVSMVMPKYASRIKFYEDTIPLFNRFQVEGQIETAFNREVRLPSGGSIVIDPTEALVSIDINSARATKGADIEATATQTNLEAADEVARQLRLRDMGGLIVIDFIDMNSSKNQRAVENRVRDALEIDRARVQVGRISRFGLLEMSRQRLRPSLGETSGMVCPRCTGQGTIRDTRSLALAILRLLQEETAKERTGEVRCVVPVDVAAFLLNEKRSTVNEIEQTTKVRVLIIPNPHMDTPHFEITRLRDDEIEEDAVTSYDVEVEVPDSLTVTDDNSGLPSAPQPLVRGVTPKGPAPVPTSESADATEPTAPTTPSAPAPEVAKTQGNETGGLFTKVWKTLFAPVPTDDTAGEEKAKTDDTAEPASAEAAQEETTNRESRSGGQRRSRGGRNRNRGGRDGRDGGRDGAPQETRNEAKPSTPAEASEPAANQGDDGESEEDRPKRSRRRRGRRGGQRRNNENGSESGTELTSESAQADDSTEEDRDAQAETPVTASSDEQQARHRPPEMKRENRRRRRRGPRPDSEGASVGVAGAEGAEGAEVAISHAAAGSTATVAAAAVPSPTTETATEIATADVEATAPVAQTDDAAAGTMSSEDAARQDTAEVVTNNNDNGQATDEAPAASTDTVDAQEEPSASTEESDISVEEASEARLVLEPRKPAPEAPVQNAAETTIVPSAASVEPAAEPDRSGLDENGRAVNDPRIAAKPVIDVNVHTERRQLFSAQEAPPVSIMSQDVPRASNDPRGPKAGASATTEKQEEATDNPVTEDLFKDAAGS